MFWSMSGFCRYPGRKGNYYGRNRTVKILSLQQVRKYCTGSQCFRCTAYMLRWNNDRAQGKFNRCSAGKTCACNFSWRQQCNSESRFSSTPDAPRALYPMDLCPDSFRGLFQISETGWCAWSFVWSWLREDHPGICLLQSPRSLDSWGINFNFSVDRKASKWYYLTCVVKRQLKLQWRSAGTRKCRNWQTSKTKDLVTAMLCGFKSHLPHAKEKSNDFSFLY